MSTLPTLPLCGEPAMIRIELYTAGSLDACAYTCAAHSADATVVIGRAGLDAQPVGLAPDVSRPCGYVHVYATGTLATPENLSHPRWCDRDDCERRGQHRSRARHVDTNQPEPVVVDVALVQSLATVSEPMMTLAAIEGTAAASLTLSMRQARVLRYRLSRLLDLAKATRNGGRWL